jgi:hypothetical protein
MVDGMAAEPPAHPGAYRRAITLEAVDATSVTGALEDDFHHFVVRLRHDGTVVTALRSEAVRHPWTTCPDADARLDHLVGMPLDPRSTTVADHDDPHAHCTHVFDLVGLAVAHAWRSGHGGAAVRRYDAVVPDRDADDRTTLDLARDGEPLLHWLVDRDRILGPDPWTGVALRGGFLGWAESTLDTDLAEAVIVARRATYISQGREHRYETGVLASEAGQRPGVCHSFQPAQITIARWTGRQRDFSTGPGPLTA